MKIESYPIDLPILPLVLDLQSVPAPLETKSPHYLKLEMGLEKMAFPLHERLPLESLKRSLEELSFSDDTRGLILFDGPLDLLGIFSWNPLYKERFAEWLKETYQSKETWVSHFQGEEKRQRMRLFCLNIVGEFLEQLATALPYDLPILISFSTGEMKNLAHIAQLLCIEPLRNFEISLGEDSSSATKGLVIPQEQSFRGDILTEFHNLLSEQKERLRLIPEKAITEKWEGLDEIYYVEGSISAWSRRALVGFEAAGGKVIAARFERELL